MNKKNLYLFMSYNNSADGFIHPNTEVAHVLYKVEKVKNDRRLITFKILECLDKTRNYDINTIASIWGYDWDYLPTKIKENNKFVTYIETFIDDDNYGLKRFSTDEEAKLYFNLEWGDVI